MASKPQQDLTNQIFGQLTVLEYAGNSQWLCQCSCGNKKTVKTASLKSGKTKSCGCLRGQNLKGNTRQMGPRIDLTGQRFGKLIALEYIKGGSWKCQCDCGNTIIVDTRNLNSGHTKSCGCYLKEVNSQNNTIDMSNFENEGIKVLERASSDIKGQATWKCLCKKCGNTFIARGAHLRAGATRSCGCVHSWNEQLITKMLLDNNIEFATQYTFSDLFGVNGGKLRFDFAIFQNGKLHHLLEFNGKQHYERAQGSWAEGFETLQIHDQLKLQYCKDNNIELRIIKFDEEYDINDLI